MSDSPAIIQFNSDGYELPILEGDAVGNVPAILGAGSDGYNYHVIALDELGKQLVKEQNQLVPFEYDHISMTYGGPPKRLLASMIYRKGGVSGIIVATISYTYDAYDNVTAMVRV